MFHHLAASSSPNPLVPNWTEVLVGAIAFFIVFLALWKVLLPRIMKTLEERTDAIEGGLERAKETQAEAQRLFEEYQAKLAEARHEASRMRQEATEWCGDHRADARAGAGRGTAHHRGSAGPDRS